MDRTVLESDPHSVLEGMLIGAFAIGAEEGFIYVRNEYPLAIEILEHAIEEAEQRGILGDNIFWDECVVSRNGSPRRGGLHLRRGNGVDRIARRSCRRASQPSALPRNQRLVGENRRSSTT